MTIVNNVMVSILTINKRRSIHKPLNQPTNHSTGQHLILCVRLLLSQALSFPEPQEPVMAKPVGHSINSPYDPLIH